MVQLQIVPTTPKERARRKRRQQFLAAAASIVGDAGPDALTMAALAERCDCAVGTAYSYFPSKSALLAAVARNSVDTLRRSQLAARGEWESYLEARRVGEEEAALVRLVAFGAFVVASSLAYPHEVAMLQVLLGDHRADLADAEVDSCLPALTTFLEEPASLVRLAEGVGALDAGDATERAILWLVALNGVLLSEGLARLAPGVVRTPHLARRLSSDLLVAWGADADRLARASGHVERLAAITPLAPPVDPVDL
jgi:AcrR family transcriptional regulator